MLLLTYWSFTPHFYDHQTPDATQMSLTVTTTGASASTGSAILPMIAGTTPMRETAQPLQLPARVTSSRVIMEPAWLHLGESLSHYIHMYRKLTL